MTSPDSNVLLIPASTDNHQFYSGKRRLVPLATVLPITTTTVDSNGKPKIQAQEHLHTAVSAWLAWFHVDQAQRQLLNESSVLLTDVLSRLRDCDIQFLLDLRDSQLSSLQSAKEFSQLVGAHVADSSISDENNQQLPSVDGGVASSDKPLRPVALIGSLTSRISVVLSTLASAYDIPQVSPSATSSSLDIKEIYPEFARTIPTNQGDALALLRYYAEIGVTNVCVLYFDDEFGTSYAFDIVRMASKHLPQVNVKQFAFDEDSIPEAVHRLAQSRHKHVFAIADPDNSLWKQLLGEALGQDVLGVPGYAWMFAESALYFLEDSFVLDRTDNQSAALARGLHGSGVLLMQPHTDINFEQAIAEFENSPDQRSQFIRQIGSDTGNFSIDD